MYLNPGRTRAHLWPSSRNKSYTCRVISRGLDPNMQRRIELESYYRKSAVPWRRRISVSWRRFISFNIDWGGIGSNVSTKRLSWWHGLVKRRYLWSQQPNYLTTTTIIFTSAAYRSLASSSISSFNTWIWSYGAISFATRYQMLETICTVNHPCILATIWPLLDRKMSRNREGCYPTEILRIWLNSFSVLKLLPVNLTWAMSQIINSDKIRERTEHKIKQKFWNQTTKQQQQPTTQHNN